MTGPANGSRAGLLEFLRAPAAGSHAPPPAYIETHISDVFLTGDTVYKLRKPVDFGFLDFSTREARYLDCWNEVLLNRRLTDDVYEAVVPIFGDEEHGHTWGPQSGIPRDWLVRMRRLDDADSLQSRIRARLANSDDIARILERLVPFFRACAVPGDLTPPGYVARFRTHVNENAQALERGQKSLQSAHGWGRHAAALLQYLALENHVLEERCRGGWVREGHGDLRAEHVYLERGGVQVIDCVEFRREYRTLDLLDEVGFLESDLWRLERGDLAGQLNSGYRDALRDDGPESLGAFYRIYRDQVRAKVAWLRMESLSPEQRGPVQAELEEQLKRLLETADRERRLLPAARLIVVCGLSGTGKSTVAGKLVDMLGARWLSTDRVRKARFGLSPTERSSRPDLYSDETTEWVYAEILAAARQTLVDEQITVVLDGTYRASRHRDAVLQLGEQLGCRVDFMVCTLPNDIARARIADRESAGTDVSDAGLHVRQAQELSGADYGGIPLAHRFLLSTAEGPAVVCERAVEWLRRGR